MPNEEQLYEKSVNQTVEPILNRVNTITAEIEGKLNLLEEATEDKKLDFWQLWNMSFGFLGIQFGWGLQMANMSAIFEHLGAEAHQIPILWIAGPITGLVVQPIVGSMSDNTWGPLGRRRPYFLFGAIFSSLALVLMPHSSTLWMAAGLLWLLDTSANISMEPFRAFVGDLLPEKQRTRGFAMQSLFIGLGTVSASSLPWILNHIFEVSRTSSAERAIPLTVELSFYTGGAFFLGSVLWTVLTTKEYPPENMGAFQREQNKRDGFLDTFQDIISAWQDMPPKMAQLAWVQCFTWLGMYCFFLYFPPAVARNIFAAASQADALYAEGIEWAGICIASYNLVCVGCSFVLPRLAKVTDRKVTHSICLMFGAVGLMSLFLIHNQYWLLLPMIGIGIAWSSILAMPYAMLVGCLPPERSGIYMGIFNFFIVLPEIFVSLGFGWVMENLLQDNRLMAVVIGGGFLFVAALLNQRVETTNG